ncbi:Flp family type IVb pilin [Polycladidibacter stylochi]|uniref:Flp family type IVb pilin n=1 Tax=Polycladidibacter stylochi TaxID=1807766 RepID=UPI0009E6FFF0|nr:Flp family type IVb pilin [Pseudovibrio stylochi]
MISLLRLSRKSHCGFSLPYLTEDEKGAVAIEYALIAASIAVIVVTAFLTLGSSLGTSFEDTGDKIANTANHMPQTD